MIRTRLVFITILLSLLPALAAAHTRISPKTGAASENDKKAIDALNQKEIDASLKMDHAASSELWAEDGVDLIQGLAPMIGKQAISKWYDSLTPQLRDAKIEYCIIEWRDIKIHGDWAWEWGINRQKIDFPPPQKPFESVGKILFILKRQADKSWKIELESWNSSPQPGSN